MKNRLTKRIFLNFILVIVLFGILCALFGTWLINRNILDEAQRRVSLDLGSAWSVLQNELDRLHLFVNVLGTGKRVEAAYLDPHSQWHRSELEAARIQFGFDFLSLTDTKGKVILRAREPYTTGDYLFNDPFVNAAIRGKATSGIAVLSSSRLRAEGENLEETAFMVFEATPKAKIRAKTTETSGMVLIAAAPVQDETGKIVGTIYAGLLLNRNHTLVDKIRSIVFENKMYKGRHLGTVTIFQWDTRIATNVTLLNGNRAIGTRVSQVVYDKVLENNLNWYDRAFVVTDWYLSAYDPIHDIEGKVIGILYVGVLAKRYDDLKYGLWRLYGVLSAAAGLLVLSVGLLFSRRLTGSIGRLADAAGKISRGNLDLKVKEPATDDEIRDLTLAFNHMAGSLKDREEKLKRANEDLENMNISLHKANRNYLDMLGFVSHELKNTLGVVYTSARTLNSGMVGNLEGPQATLVQNISKNIDTAVRMTRKYLDLARIEKGELKLNNANLDILKDVVAPVIEDLQPVISEKQVDLQNRLIETLMVNGDRDLLRIVYKNFLDNALTYGKQNGTIKLGYSRDNGLYIFEVWNDGEGLSLDKMDKLFIKFARLNKEKASSRSTGLGLFISKDIIEKHGGTVRAESKEGEWINFIFTIPVSKDVIRQIDSVDT